MSRIQRIGTWVAVFSMAFLFAGETFGGGRSTMRRGGHRRTVADHVVAYAALEALPGEDGWGRFVVRDDLLPSGDERSVSVALYGLEPDSQYRVEADGVEIGMILTDRRGDASVKLETRGRHMGDVPDDLPAATDILRASVQNYWGGMVLDGIFTVVREHISDPIVHREKIRLDAEDGFDAEGMAGVCRKESGAQGFATMAAGLEPGLSYSIVVDSLAVGIVTADEGGQAGLELHVPDDDNPLPDALQPVENIRHVQWFQGELLILSGVFSGESDMDERCRELEGRFAGLTDSGFVLRKGDDEVEIVVTDETEFEGFDELGQLEEGDWLEVKVCTDGDQLLARSVELEEHERECDELHGAFARLTDSGFVLEKGDVEVEIVVTDDTEFEGFDGLGQLEEGDRLEVEVCWDGEQLVASSVELKEAERECDRLLGNVVSRTESGFVLGLGDERIEVVVTDETELKNFDSLDELDGGEVVVLEGCFDEEVLVAAWVKLLVDNDCVELRGIVAERTNHGFVLQKGDEFVEVMITDETELEGFESLDGLEVGDEVALEGCFDGEVLVAAWVCLFEKDDCVELHGVVAERTDSGFVLQKGNDFVEVVVTGETELKGFESLDELAVGDEVGLEGCFDGDLLVAAWVRLYADEPELEWWVADGTVVDLLDYGFAFEADGEVVIVKITDETVLEGFENAGQIAEGDVVLVEGWWDGEKVFAARVVRGGP